VGREARALRAGGFPDTSTSFRAEAPISKPRASTLGRKSWLRLLNTPPPYTGAFGKANCESLGLSITLFLHLATP